MSVPASAPSPIFLAAFAGAMAGGLFLLPRLSASVPFLALPLGVAGLFSALPLLLLRVSGRLPLAVLALGTAVLLVSVVGSPEAGIGFALLFGLWGMVGGEVLARRRSVIAGCAAGFVVLATEALFASLSEGTAPVAATLSSPQFQAAFDQWATQAQLEPAEAKATIDRVRTGIVALYPSLTMITAATIVAINAIALGRLVHLSRAASFPKNELQMLRWPLALVVTFVLSGTLLLLPGAETVGWNGLVITLFLFLLQGLSVLSFALARVFPSQLMRTLLVMASLVGPWAVLLSLLGLFDQWFDFRKQFASPDAPTAPSLQ